MLTEAYLDLPDLIKYYGEPREVEPEEDDLSDRSTISQMPLNFALISDFKTTGDLTADKVNMTSVTRVCEIPPLWKNFKTPGQIFEGWLVFGKLLTLIWPPFLQVWQFFVLADDQTLKKILAIWSHWTRLPPVRFDAQIFLLQNRNYFREVKRERITLLFVFKKVCSKPGLFCLFFSFYYFDKYYSCNFNNIIWKSGYGVWGPQDGRHSRNQCDQIGRYFGLWATF